MRYKEPFTLFPRKTKNGRDIWYFRTYDDNGARTTARSTGTTNKTAARQYTVDLLKSGNILPTKNPTFKEYVRDWWLWDRCSYVLSKRARGSRIGQTYVGTNRMYLESHILPYLSKYRISAITPRIVERTILDLRNKKSKYGKPLSPTSVNHVLSCLKIIFREAVRLGDLARILEKHIYAQRQLKPVLVFNPFAETLTFPSSSLKTRRDNEKFLRLINVICFLHQYQKCRSIQPFLDTNGSI